MKKQTGVHFYINIVNYNTIIMDEEEKTHTGIQNVRERLKRVSGGELRIDSELGKGTIATIIIRDD